MPEGYCTVDDVRRVLQDNNLSGALDQDNNQTVVDAIVSQSEWLQETTNRHWFDPDGAEEDHHELIPDGPLKQKADEQDITTRPFVLADDDIAPATNGPGPYTGIKLFRRDVRELTELLVLTDDGSFVDWVDDPDYNEGRGEAYYLQVDDADGWSTLYLDTTALDDDELTDYRNAVVATYEYGIEGLTGTLRRGTAALAALTLLTDDEAALGIPDNGNLIPRDSKISVIRDEAERLLEIHDDPR